MRLLELRLLAYGPFTDAVLRFDEEPALEVIYGPNEAGKSTALRAITGLFYGIAEKTTDDHLHEKPRMRIGGLLRAGDGAALELTRRKGRKATLLDPRGEPLDEAILRRALGGVGRELFLTMFGLDHRTLREAGQALLAGRGDLGESLFDAGGARGVGEVLARLRAEAEALFKARGSTPALNEALREHKEAKQRIVLKETLPRGYLDQKERYGEAQRQHRAAIEQRQRLSAERSRLERFLRVQPHLARRRELAERRLVLGEIPSLPEDATERRLAAERRLEASARDAERLEYEIAARRAERDRLVVNEPLAALDEEVIAELRDRLGRVRAAAHDLPKRQGQLGALEREVERLVGELGRAGTEPSSLAVDRALVARIDKLARSFERLSSELERVESELAERRAAEALLRERLAERRDEGSLEPWKLAVRRASRAGDLDAEHEAARAAVEALTAKIERARAQLAMRVDPLSLAMPSRETIDRHEAAEAALEARHAQNARERAALAREADEIRAALEELALGGDVPSATELAEARGQRDALWQRVRGESAGHDEYEAAVAASDHLADRLWREADRVAQRGRLAARRDQLARESEALASAAAELEAERAAARSEWMALWRERGLDPRSPDEMRRTLELHASLLELAGARDEAEARRQLVASKRRELREQLVPLLAGDDPLPDGDRLAPCLDAAESALAMRTARREERRLWERELEQLTLDRSRREEERAERAALLEAWRASWRECMQRLGLRDAALVEEAAAYLGALRELGASLRQVDDLRGRIAGIERDAEGFARDVRVLAARCLDAGDGDPQELAEQLLRGHERARQAELARRRIEQEIAERSRELEAAEQSAAEARAVLSELVRLARVADESELEAAERRWQTARDLDAELAREEERLFEAGEGATLEELESTRVEHDVDRAKVRLSELTDEHAELERTIDELNQQIGASRRGLELLEQKEGAFGAAADVQASLAAIRSLAERYARTRLAVRLLEQEIERYRADNQGPIVTRAGELFPRLTLGAYRSLAVDYHGGDEPELRCVRADGRDVGVEGLSDGTRDQLYLALRLASLERYVEQNEPVPFVLDDILIHFDVERARAALSVLSDLASRLQILFFTHNAHLLELAREVVPRERLREHRLASNRKRQAAALQTSG